MFRAFFNWFKPAFPGLEPGEAALHVPPLPPLSWAAEVALWHHLLTTLGEFPVFVRESAFVTAKAHPAGYGRLDPFDPMDGASLAPCTVEVSRVRLLWKNHFWDWERQVWVPAGSPENPLSGRLFESLRLLCPESSKMTGSHGNTHPLRRLSRRQARPFCVSGALRLHPVATHWLEEAFAAMAPVIRAKKEQAALEKTLPDRPVTPPARRL
jgi:hypothetical protein